MIWLYEEFETNFDYNGVPLNTAYEADIHRVLNGLYKLSFKLPTTDDELYSLIEKGMILKANEKGRTNLFRIKYREFNDNDNSLSIVAYQIFISDFSKKLVRNFSVIDRPCVFALAAWHDSFFSSQDRLLYESSINDKSSFSTFKDDKDNESKDSIETLNGIASAYNADVDLHNFKVTLKDRIGRDTEEVLITSKNISEFVDEFNEDEIYTRIYATSTFRPDVDKEELRAGYKAEREALKVSQKSISELIRKKKVEERIQSEIDSRYTKELSKITSKVKNPKTAKSYEQIEREIRVKYNNQLLKSEQRKRESSALAAQRKAEMDALKKQQKEDYQSLTEEITISISIDSPFIDDYPFINELSISNNDCRTVDELYDWANSYFTEKNIDKPKRSIKVNYEQINENITLGDTVIVKHERANIDERIKVVETHYDPMGQVYTSYILGEITTSFGGEVAKGIDTGIGELKGYFNGIIGNHSLDVEQQLRNFDRVFDNKFDEAKAEIEEAQERAKSDAEVYINEVKEQLDNKISTHKSDVESITNDFKGRLNTAESGLRDLKTGVEAIPEKTKLMIVDEISKINLDDAIINNSTFVNLDNRISELSTNFNSKFDSNGNLISFRDFMATYNSSNSEINSKLEVLERYKNEDGSRRDNILSLAERQTGELINTSLTDIRSKFDTSGKLIELKTFENSYSANAREINSKLSSIQTFIDGEGARNDNIINLIESKTSDSISRELNSITNNFITKNVYTEKVDSIEHRLSQVSLRNENLVPYSEGFWRPFEFNEQIYYFMWISKIHVNCVPKEVFTISSKANVIFTIKFINNIGDETGETAIFERSDSKQDLTFTIPEGIFRFYLTVHKADGSNISSTEIVNIMKTTKVENSNIATPFTVCSLDRQADSIVMVSSFNYFKQTLDQRLASISGVASNGQRLASEIDQRLTGITAKVSTLENNTLKYADIDISNNAIQLGVGNVINGTTLASLISVSPTAINMITDKVVITKNNENLVNGSAKNKCVTTSDVTMQVTNNLSFPIATNDEFLITGEIKSLENVANKNLKIFLSIAYEGNFTVNQPEVILLNGSNINKTTISVTYKIRYALLTNRALISFRFILLPDSHPWEICNLSIIQKKSAELIVDGSITTKHLATNSITAGLIASGAIETKHLTTNSVVASVLKVDQALIDKLLVNDLLVNSITAKSAFINKIKTIELDASKITSGYISADRIRGGTITGTTIGADVKIKLGAHGFMQAINDGLQICAPHGIYNFGVGFQFNGRSKTVMIRGVDYNVPKGLYIYNDDDFSSGDPIPTLPFTEVPLLTVESPIKASTRNGFKGFCVVSNPNRNGVNQEYAVEYLQMSKYNSGHYLLVEGSGTGVQLNGIAYSDKKLKENIQPSNVIALDYVKRFNFKEFNWKDGGLFERLGLVAQDLQLIDRDLVRESLLDKNLYLNTTYLLNLSLKAIQELNTKFENNVLKVGLLMAEREEYIATIKNLEKRIEILENKENVA